jgi:hypothetical protein
MAVIDSGKLAELRAVAAAARAEWVNSFLTPPPRFVRKSHIVRAVRRARLGSAGTEQQLRSSSNSSSNSAGNVVGSGVLLGSAVAAADAVVVAAAAAAATTRPRLADEDGVGSGSAAGGCPVHPRPLLLPHPNVRRVQALLCARSGRPMRADEDVADVGGAAAVAAAAAVEAAAAAAAAAVPSAANIIGDGASRAPASDALGAASEAEVEVEEADDGEPHAYSGNAFAGLLCGPDGADIVARMKAFVVVRRPLRLFPARGGSDTRHTCIHAHPPTHPPTYTHALTHTHTDTRAGRTRAQGFQSLDIGALLARLPPQDDSDDDAGSAHAYDSDGERERAPPGGRGPACVCRCAPTHAAAAAAAVVARPAAAAPPSRPRSGTINEAPPTDRIRALLSRVEDMMRTHRLFRGVTGRAWDELVDGLERCVMCKLYDKVWRLHPRAEEKDAALLLRLESLAFVDFHHLDMAAPPPALANGWRMAQAALLEMDEARAPCDKMACIMNCCRIVSTLLSLASQEVRSIGADEFLPALIYTVLHARPPHLWSNLRWARGRLPRGIV